MFIPVKEIGHSDALIRVQLSRQIIKVADRNGRRLAFSSTSTLTRIPIICFQAFALIEVYALKCYPPFLLYYLFMLPFAL